MTAINPAAVPTVRVAIEVSKPRHELPIAVPGQKRRRRLAIPDTVNGVWRLAGLLGEADLPGRIGFAAIGNDHRALAHPLGRSGFGLKRVCPGALARTREALHDNWDKNGPKDARAILRMPEIGAVRFLHDPLCAGPNAIRELSKAPESVSRAKSELWHRNPTHDRPLSVPAAEPVRRSLRSDWFPAFLEEVPSPHAISAMAQEAFRDAARDVVGRKVSRPRMLSDIDLPAKGSVGLPVAHAPDALRMFRRVPAAGRSRVRRRNEIAARAVGLLSDLPDDRLPTAIPGIGPITAMTILAEAGDIRRFGHHGQFPKVCGIDLATVRPGMFRGRSKISGHGNARLRRPLRIGGQTAVLKRTDSFRDTFER